MGAPETTRFTGTVATIKSPVKMATSIWSRAARGLTPSPGVPATSTSCPTPTAGSPGVQVDLNAGSTSGTSGSDHLSGFEVVTGSNFHDTLTGSNRFELFAGFDGQDRSTEEGV